MHVTLRVADHVWNLRSERSFRVIHAALTGVRSVAGFRIIHFSVQGYHLHLIVEADGAGSLASGMRASGAEGWLLRHAARADSHRSPRPVSASGR